jgi:hypothetical protein
VANPIVSVLALLLTVLLLVVGLPVFLLARLVAALPAPARVVAAARLTALVGIYLALFELPALTGTLRLRCARPRTAAGAREDDPRYLALDRKLLARFFGPGCRLAGLTLRPFELPDRPAERPVVLLARHAGLFNSQFMYHLVGNVLGGEPVGVGKRAVCLDPGQAALLSQMRFASFRWNRAGRQAASVKLTELAGTLRAGDYLVLFPEGTNFTARRRRRAIACLRAHGLTAQAEHAETLRSMLPPHLAGVRHLLDAAPTADVLFVCHTGLEDLMRRRSRLGYRTRQDGVLRFTTWVDPNANVPRERVARDVWLLTWWRQLDAWVARQCQRLAVAAPPRDDPRQHAAGGRRAVTPRRRARLGRIRARRAAGVVRRRSDPAAARRP